MENKLLEHFIHETGKKFDRVYDEMGEIKGQLSDLTKFKIEMIASSRLTSLIVSAALGLVTLVVTTAVSVYVTGKVQAQMIKNAGVKQ